MLSLVDGHFGMEKSPDPLCDWDITTESKQLYSSSTSNRVIAGKFPVEKLTRRSYREVDISCLDQILKKIGLYKNEPRSIGSF